MPAQHTMDDDQRGVRALLLGDDPPPVRLRTGRKLIVLGSAGLLLSAMILVVLFNLDQPAPTDDAKSRFGPITDIVSPEGLSEADLARAGTGRQRDPAVELPSGAWIQVADEAGRLAQQYRFASLDPSPAGAGPGYLQMRDPDAEIYLSEGRVLTLTGDSALAYVPASLLESGDLRGNVVIQLFEPRHGTAVNLGHDQPALVATTSEARFDNMLGEIVCNPDVHVESPSLEFDGRKLRMQINDRDGTIHLTVDEPERIRLVRSAEAGGLPINHGALTDAPLAASPVHQEIVNQPVSANQTATGSSSSPVMAQKSQFYHLTLHDNVLIVQGQAQNERRITGDELELVFSLESEGVNASLACLPDPVEVSGDAARPLTADGAIMTLPEWVTALAIAVPSDSPTSILPPFSSEDIIITCSGKLVMTPLDEDLAALASPEDARLELRGRPVRMNDRQSKSTATCAVMVHRSLDQRTELHGSDAYPVELEMPEMRADGPLFWVNHSEDRAGFLGEGSLDARDQTPARDPSQIAPRQPLHITWVDGVDLEFDKAAATADQSGKLRRATFSGDVEVMSEEMYVYADRLAVAFEPSAAGESEARRIEADGSVRAESLADPGSLRCDRLLVELTQDRDNETIPQTMTATGAVEAMDDVKTIWANSIFVRFRTAPVPLVAGASETSLSTDASTGTSPLDEADIEQFIADGDVQVVLDKGGRVFADRVVGDNATHTMTLTGKPVKVIYDTVVFERETEVVVTEKEEANYRLNGPGRATVYPSSVQPAGRERITPPTITGDPEIQVQWSETMIYDSRFNEGGGSLDFRGDVEATATPSKFEENSINGDSLLLEFEKAATTDEPGAHDANAENVADRPAANLPQGDRRIRKLIARGSAELESRTWMDEQRADKPRVFNVAGDHVEYDDETGEAIVIGNGRLLIRDEREEPTATPESASENSPFGRKGTTLFKWNEKLHMTRQADALHKVIINGDVEVLHKALDGAIATLTCRDLEASIKREPSVDSPAADRADDDPFDLGGSAELRYLRAQDRVYIKTATREVECALFLFDTERQIAEIAAGAGSFATILTTGSGQTQRVERAVWDLAADTITIDQGSGSVPR